MKSSSSSSGTSTSIRPETLLLSSSSSPPPCLSLRSPELQAKFLDCLSKFQPDSDLSESDVVSSPSSPTPSSSSSSPLGCSSSRPARLSLSSPELLSELKETGTRSLRHVSPHRGLTRVFSGRGGQRQVSDSTPSTQPANHKPSH
ncbi:zinc finger HIT domain-containing protein 1 isoform X2 [Mastacembelus armatus]|uniref:zinc finger HIT domain-containing protein 1 isoform X2 n=1 Tax=Mastacembelus armatus TaxID=205130 RepID=UPI000E45E2A6|nr:zinc finger HIT domain-containing protein 1 isoform X2 [Mastacembelus armatus]